LPRTRSDRRRDGNPLSGKLPDGAGWQPALPRI
jgi:hypothetical protein